MIKQSTARMIIDSAMAIISLMLLGGNYFFPWTGVHEILGVSLFVLWGIHVAQNRRWYGSLLKGSYRPIRIMQSTVNCGILVCALFLMISGVMLSQHVFVFLGIDFGANFSRIAHLLASHWYFLFMSLHIGLHVQTIAMKEQNGTARSSARLKSNRCAVCRLGALRGKAAARKEKRFLNSFINRRKERTGTSSFNPELSGPRATHFNGSLCKPFPLSKNTHISMF
ncbi:DUF4405 domain-containing protein [Treponema parvum]|uniref:DUF4405 domain-containing protein n=1 Tax=Treponema parvum TaxID=138851 RepID=UPI001AEC4348|nr:DUF4405 domain-containing protein [Treponema parvum]QTQ15450.1 DUF4405 domain-containing protein [Treponema parvum]